MTVQELIEELKQFPMNREVNLICEFDGGWACTLPNIVDYIGIDRDTNNVLIEGKGRNNV